MSDRFCVESSAAAADPRSSSCGAGVCRRCWSFTMTLNPQAIVLTAFGVVMAAAAFEDFRRLIIPNLLPIMLCALWPLYFAAAPSLYGALAAIGCAAAGVCV